jgi:hypothetical protein
MPDAEMPIFRGQPNVAREALQGGEPQKKSESSRGRSNGPFAVRAQCSAVASRRCSWRMASQSVKRSFLSSPGVRVCLTVLSPKSFSSLCLSALCLSLSPTSYPALCWLLPRKPRQAAASSDVLALSISAFRSLLLPFLATSNTLPLRYGRKQTSSLSRPSTEHLNRAKIQKRRVANREKRGHIQGTRQTRRARQVEAEERNTGTERPQYKQTRGRDDGLKLPPC